MVHLTCLLLAHNHFRDPVDYSHPKSLLCCLMPVKAKAIPVVVGSTLKESQAIKHIAKYHHMLVSDDDNEGYKPGLWPPSHHMQAPCKAVIASAQLP